MISTIVIGWLNTDLVATGLPRFPAPGERVFGDQLTIGPGGTSRNIADMIAHLAPVDTVAMVGKTVRDPYGLWKIPVDALESVGVNTQYITILDDGQSRKLPGIALIPVDTRGNNQIIVLPGVGDDFGIDDIEAATPLFEAASTNAGVLVLTLECPLATAVHAVKKANQLGLKVMFDPGGIQAGSDITELIEAGVYLIKPNEHETKLLTGVEVVDFDSAKAAASMLLKMGIENVFITAGAGGAYLFSGTIEQHIPVPSVKSSDHNDETGSGDQTMAALCAGIQAGKPLADAAKLAVLAGTLQFHRVGIQPLGANELTEAS